MITNLCYPSGGFLYRTTTFAHVLLLVACLSVRAQAPGDGTEPCSTYDLTGSCDVVFATLFEEVYELPGGCTRGRHSQRYVYGDEETRRYCAVVGDLLKEELRKKAESDGSPDTGMRARTRSARNSKEGIAWSRIREEFDGDLRELEARDRRAEYREMWRDARRDLLASARPIPPRAAVTTGGTASGYAVVGSVVRLHDDAAWNPVLVTGAVVIPTGPARSETRRVGLEAGAGTRLGEWVVLGGPSVHTTRGRMQAGAFASVVYQWPRSFSLGVSISTLHDVGFRIGLPLSTTLFGNRVQDR
jgi:hypothetical protein